MNEQRGGREQNPIGAENKSTNIHNYSSVRVCGIPHTSPSICKPRSMTVQYKWGGRIMASIPSDWIALIGMEPIQRFAVVRLSYLVVAICGSLDTVILGQSSRHFLFRSPTHDPSMRYLLFFFFCIWIVVVVKLLSAIQFNPFTHSLTAYRHVGQFNHYTSSSAFFLVPLINDTYPQHEHSQTQPTTWYLIINIFRSMLSLSLDKWSSVKFNFTIHKYMHTHSRRSGRYYIDLGTREWVSEFSCINHC